MKTVVNFILDKSGSMYDIKKATISGFNEYLQTLKKKEKANNKILFSLTLFDTEIINKCIAKPIKSLRKLTAKSYQPDGLTALYDAVVETVEESAEKIKEIKGKVKSLVVIMTDGLENSSTRHNEGCLRDLIKKLKRKDWTFVFLGANQDSWATTANWGLGYGNMVNFQCNNATQVANTFKNLASNTVAYACSAQPTTDNFFEGKKDLSNDS